MTIIPGTGNVRPTSYERPYTDVLASVENDPKPSFDLFILPLSSLL